MKSTSSGENALRSSCLYPNLIRVASSALCCKCNFEVALVAILWYHESKLERTNSNDPHIRCRGILVSAPWCGLKGDQYNMNGKMGTGKFARRCGTPLDVRIRTERWTLNILDHHMVAIMMLCSSEKTRITVSYGIDWGHALVNACLNFEKLRVLLQLSTPRKYTRGLFVFGQNLKISCITTIGVLIPTVSDNFVWVGYENLLHSIRTGPPPSKRPLGRSVSITTIIVLDHCLSSNRTIILPSVITEPPYLRSYLAGGGRYHA